MIQVYTKEMYEEIYDIYPFSAWLLTMYKIWEGDMNTFRLYCRWCVKNDIMTITMKEEYATQEILDLAKAYDIDVYAHTINDPDRVNELKNMGVSGVYTDALSGADF